jgi:CheY-like chemotaxis protein
MKKLARKSLLNLGFALAMLLFASLGWLVYLNMDAARQSDYWENHTHVVINELDSVLLALVDAETGQRGYLITGSPDYLEPYSAALGRITDLQLSLRSLTRDNPQQQQRLEKLAPVINKKLAELKETIEAREHQGQQAASRLVLSHVGKKTMDEIRRLVEVAKSQERQLLLQRTAAKKSDLAQTRLALQLGGLLGLAILCTVFGFLSREVSQRSRAEADLLLQNEALKSARDRERSQNWIKTGLNELNIRVRGDRPLQELTGTALSFLSEYLQAGAGALYLFEEQTQALTLAAGFALTRGKDRPETIALGEGLAGEAARQRNSISRGSLPPDYLSIGSALGETAPSTVLALPLLQDSRLIGVVELGSLHEFSDFEFEFLNQAADVLAISIGVIQTRQRVNELLLQSQAQEEELRVQQEELQQTNEELEERAGLLEQQREEIQAKNREMEDAGREILRKARELEQISTYKSEFLANMSHELRTPLNSLMILSGHLQENREGNLTPRQVEYAATIKSSGHELLTLINDILDLSKIESGRMEFVYEDTPLDEICRQVAGVFRPLADQKGLAFSTAVAEGVTPSIGLDTQRTLQVLKNLISNAIKFTSSGSVALQVYTPGPGECPLPGPGIAFAVADTGIGIPSAKHEMIFLAFQQADGSTSRRFGGTGLGLSISRQLARGMGGEILLQGEEGAGSVFTLYLPLVPPPSITETRPPYPPHPAAGQLKAPAPAPAPPALADDRDRLSVGERSILIIEDDLTFAGLLMERIRDRGFGALVATDGNGGIDLAHRFLPSAILLDVMLPGLDGWGVMQKLTDDPLIRHIPVHFITCMEEKQKALAMGAIGFVTKPTTSEQLDGVFGAIEHAVARTLGKLLIVEDDRAHAAALVALLEERDIAIAVAGSGAQAVELLASEPFDCIVLDLGLADMSGFDLLEHIRSLDESRRIPVIIHTGRELSTEETRKLQRYAESIIIKGAKSPERLLNEVTLFLHVMESRLPPEKQRMIRSTLDNETLLAGKKVLLVDDDMRNIFSLSSVLSELGMLIVEAENGKVALERLEEHPDVNIVLMDVMMPELDGYQATRLIRDDPRFAQLPVIALTAKAMKGDREACLKAGASDYITKPVDMDRLLSLLRVWLYHQG